MIMCLLHVHVVHVHKHKLASKNRILLLIVAGGNIVHVFISQDHCQQRNASMLAYRSFATSLLSRIQLRSWSTHW